MTIRSVVILGALACACAAARPAAADPNADARALGERFAAAVASGDVEAVLALYADDARAIYPGQGAEARGKAALRAMLVRDLPEMRKLPIKQEAADAFAIDDTHVMNVGRWAVAAGEGHPAMTVRTSELLVKDGGAWRYLVDHASIGTPPPTPHRGRPRRRR